MVESTVGTLASPLKRLMATILDAIIPSIMLVVLLGSAAIGLDAQGTSAQGVSMLLLLVFLAWVVWCFALFARGRTPGKRLLGMTVVDEGGRPAGFLRMLLREWLGKWVAGLVFGLGFIWILIDRERQGWHDKLMSTYVTG
jgi:uncharacterized RDD family membrane protein YckC